MKILTISTINRKGGAGKTSVILNLGGVLKEQGRRPLLLDIDPQGSAIAWANQGGEEFPFPVQQIKISKDVKKLKAQIDQLIKHHKADTLLLDTPPQLEEEALFAALLSDIVLIPITPSPLDIWAGKEALETVREARKARQDTLPKIILVPSRLATNTTLSKEIAGTLSSFEELVSPPISLRVAMAEAPIAGLPINLYAPKSTSHKEFTNLLKFVCRDFLK